MKIRIRLFSLLRDRAGTPQVDLELPSGATLGSAVAKLAQLHPPLAPLLDARSTLPIQFALNREYAATGARLNEGDEVAVFPPVSGGAPTLTTAATAPVADPMTGLLLLSGGFDSPVAGHLVKAGGRQLHAVHFTMEPFTDDASARKARILARNLGIARLTIIPLGEDLAEFTRHCEHKFYFLLLKRLMVRVSQELAARNGASFLVTGENLGQVSSQTLPNLGVVDAVARVPILRPLLGFDKNDIIGVAKRIGTYETSCGPEVCDVLGPAHPSTASNVAQILLEETKLDVGALVTNALSKAYDVDLSLAEEEPLPAAAACD